MQSNSLLLSSLVYMNPGHKIIQQVELAIYVWRLTHTFRFIPVVGGGANFMNIAIYLITSPSQRVNKARLHCVPQNPS